MSPDKIRAYQKIVTQVAMVVQARGAAGCFILVDEVGEPIFVHQVGIIESLSFNPRALAEEKAQLCIITEVSTARMIEDPALLGGRVPRGVVWAGAIPITGEKDRVEGALAFSGLGQWTDHTLVVMIDALYRAQLRDDLEMVQVRALANEA